MKNNYKETQKEFKERSKKVIARYDSGKRYSKSGEVRIKGVPFVNDEKRLIKEERKQRKLEKKKLLKEKREEMRFC